MKPDTSDKPHASSSDAPVIQPSASSSAAAGSSSDAAGGDPLAGLYRMSTTAGLGSQDYVAINGTAIAAVIFGLASVFVLLSSILLVIPAVAAICAIVAWRQIGRSNGTQGGRGLAALGLLLAAGFAGVLIARQVQESARLVPERKQVVQLLETFGQHIKDGRYADAHNLFTDYFKQERAPKAQFEQRFQSFQALYGNVKTFDLNDGRIDLQPMGNGLFSAEAMIILQYEKSQPVHVSARVIKMGDKWVMTEIPTIFPIPEEQQSQGPG